MKNKEDKNKEDKVKLKKIKYSKLYDLIRNQQGAVLTIHAMLDLATRHPAIKSVVWEISRSFAAGEGLQIDQNFNDFVKKDLRTLNKEISKDIEKINVKDCKLVKVTDTSKFPISQKMFGIYLLLVLAERGKINSGQFIYIKDCIPHRKYPYLSEKFVMKHFAIPEEVNKGGKSKEWASGKSMKAASKKTAKNRHVLQSTGIRSVTGGPTGQFDQIDQLNTEMRERNLTNVFNEIETKFQTKANKEGKIIKSVFFATKYGYISDSWKSAGNKLQCGHSQQQFFFSTVQTKDGRHCLYHYETTYDKENPVIKESWVKGGTEEVVAYAKFVEPCELLDVQPEIGKLTPQA